MKTIYQNWREEPNLDGYIPKESVEITGLWTRKLKNILEILIERDGKWVVVEEINLDRLADNEHSHGMGAAWLKGVG